MMEDNPHSSAPQGGEEQNDPITYNPESETPNKYTLLHDEYRDFTYAICFAAELYYEMVKNEDMVQVMSLAMKYAKENPDFILEHKKVQEKHFCNEFDTTDDLNRTHDATD